jgi:hypothetical protein
MECQYAMKQNKPLLFLVCEESYKSPTGWLGLIMGQRMWVGVFTPGMVENKADEVMRRLDETLKGENEGESAVVVGDANTTSATTTTVTHHGPTMGELVANLVKKVAKLEEKINHLESKNVVLEEKDLNSLYLFIVIVQFALQLHSHKHLLFQNSKPIYEFVSFLSLIFFSFFTFPIFRTFSNIFSVINSLNFLPQL